VGPLAENCGKSGKKTLFQPHAAGSISAVCHGHGGTHGFSRQIAKAVKQVGMICHLISEGLSGILTRKT